MMLTKTDKTRILSKADLAKDTLQDTPSKKWMSVDNPLLDYTHSRPLPKPVARRAIKYINQLVSIYPFQIRYAMAVPLWQRFSQAWCDTGDEKESLRVI
jgi:hypothetical protein